MSRPREKYTVKKLADLAGISVRTLHYYDEIGLLPPETIGDNGYRYYSEPALLRLQQILFFRELGLPLHQIKEILDRPDFDLLKALQSHRRGLLEQASRFKRLVNTIDDTIRYLQGELQMNDQDFYSGFDEEKQKQYAAEAEQRWGKEAARSQKRWESYSREKKNEILGAMNAITENIAANVEKGPRSAEVQAWVDRWYQLINQYFYPCSLEVFENLGNLYVEDPRYQAAYEKVRPGLAAFMKQAVDHFVQSKNT